MTDKVLSQDEVDALLKGVATGDVDTEESADFSPDGLRLYDFTSQDRVIRGRMPGLEKINDAFSNSFRTAISSLIMKYIDVSIENVETIKYSDFIKTIPMPSSINIFTMEPLKGYSMLILEAPLVFAFIEFFFGGASAQHVKSEGRAFTSIEQRIIQRVVDIALREIQKAWGSVIDVKPKFYSSEINPQFVSIVSPGELVINIEFNLEIEEFSGKMFFCVPYSMIEPVKDKLFSGVQGDEMVTDQRWTKIMRENLMYTSVDLAAEIGSLQVTFEDLINFEVGNIINIGKSVSDELVVKIEGVPKLKGHAGLSKGNQAVKLTGMVE